MIGISWSVFKKQTVKTTTKTKLETYPGFSDSLKLSSFLTKEKSGLTDS